MRRIRAVTASREAWNRCRTSAIDRRRHMRYNPVGALGESAQKNEGEEMDCGIVLVVDVDDEWRSRMAELLARAGLETAGAASASDALVIAHRERPAVLLLDVAPPALGRSHP